MNRKVLVSIVSIAVISLAATAVTASSFSSYTPLYTLRMEQASSEKSFLPTSTNAFTYTAEKGYTWNYDISEGCCGATPLIMTFQPTCEFYNTCDYTCTSTCPSTCSTCPVTCSYSCAYTCACCPP
jgi:hypothetical protein